MQRQKTSFQAQWQFKFRSAGRAFGAAALCLGIGGGVSLEAEIPPAGVGGAQPAPGQMARPSGAGRDIEVFDDRVFNLDTDKGRGEPETRTSAGGNTRYLDNSKQLDYNTEQRSRWLKNCESLRETDTVAFRQCVESQKAKEVGGPPASKTRTPDSMQLPRDLVPSEGNP